MAQQRLAQAEAERARLAVQEAERLRANAETEKAEIRAQLPRRLSLVLERATRPEA